MSARRKTGRASLEKAYSNTPIQMAPVYQCNQIAIYRNREPCAPYEASNIDLLSAKDNLVVFGLRHRGGSGLLLGAIEDARI